MLKLTDIDKRPPRRERLQVVMDRDTLALLREQVPNQSRSRYIENALLRRLQEDMANAE